MNVFISYRHDDSMLAARLLHAELGKSDEYRVFMDLDDIGYGADFVEVIDARLDEADVVLVVIGPKWDEMLQQRLRGDDWVRHEVARALELRARSRSAGDGRPATQERPRVIPVYVQQARPIQGPMPPDLEPLPRLNAQTLDERALTASVTSLIGAINGERVEISLWEQLWKAHIRRVLRWLVPIIGVTLFFASWVKLFDALNVDTAIGTQTMRVAGLAPAAPSWGGKAVLVGIDPATVKSIGRDFDASWRREHAQLIRAAAAAGALSVGFDLFLDAAGAPADDAALEQALRDTRTAMPVVFGVRDMDGNAPRLLPRFAALAHYGIACAGQRLSQARAMPLAVQRDASPAAAGAAPAAPRDRVVVHPSLGLATYSGGGRVEPLDEKAQTVSVLIEREQRSQVASYFYTEGVDTRQDECMAIVPGDRTANQLFDPFTMPALAEPPQRIAYERVLHGDPAALALLRGRVVLVGLQLPGVDELPMSGPGGKRWGVDLIAAQIDELARQTPERPTAVRPIGGWAQAIIMTAMAALGAFLVRRLRGRPWPLRAAAWVGGPLAFAAIIVAWYRMEGQLIALPYGVVAFWLGAGLMLVLIARKKT